MGGSRGAAGGSGLLIKAAYRPRGGAKYSLHKVNAALDLDILPADYDKTRLWYETAVRVWCMAGRAGFDADDGCAPMYRVAPPPGTPAATPTGGVGLGLYCKPGRFDGIRVHIDTGKRCRTWQYYKGKAVFYPAAFTIADDLGLEFPTRAPRRDAK
jgi:hypothetical protein